jgi:hypothetical protein
MDARTTDTVPLACVPGAIPAEERPAHFALVAELFATAVLERTEVPGGYGFRFADERFESVAKFVANERKCCPFLDFEITVPAAGGPVWLRMTGPEGTREFLDAELPG